MKYVREFTLQASHFNDQAQYDAYKWVASADAQHAESAMQCLLREVLPNVHGHNFLIQIEAEGANSDVNSAGWLVSDMALEALVRQWDNTNLSVHPDFAAAGLRATTENMVLLLLGKLSKAYPNLDFYVTVEENGSISAEAGSP